VVHVAHLHYADTLLVAFDDRTCFLESSSLMVTLRDEKRKTRKQQPHQQHSAMCSFTFLLDAPTEYLTRNSRVEFWKRALLLDFLICKGSKLSIKELQSLATLRCFMLRLFPAAGTIDHRASIKILSLVHALTARLQILLEATKHLQSELYAAAEIPGQYRSITSSLVELCYRLVLPI
jgi:hypothetical protein